MRIKSMLVKGISLAIIVMALFYYNSCVLKNQDAIAEAQAKAGAQTATAAGKYKDGSYQGSAQGYGGSITCKVTIKGGNISNIDVVSAAGEDAAYYNQALAVLDSIAAKQTTEGVDVVSGASYSSRGLIGACKAALAKAGGGND